MKLKPGMEYTSAARFPQTDFRDVQLFLRRYNRARRFGRQLPPVDTDGLLSPAAQARMERFLAVADPCGATMSEAHASSLPTGDALPEPLLQTRSLLAGRDRLRHRLASRTGGFALHREIAREPRTQGGKIHRRPLPPDSETNDHHEYEGEY